MLANKFNLAGSDETARAKCDVVVDTIIDAQNAYVKHVFSIAKDQQEAAMVKFLAEEAPKHLALLEKLCGLYGSSGHTVGNSVTWADIGLFNFTAMLHEKDAHLLDKFPHVAKVKKTVEEHPKIAAWLQKRPQTAF